MAIPTQSTPNMTAATSRIVLSIGIMTIKDKGWCQWSASNNATICNAVTTPNDFKDCVRCDTLMPSKITCARAF
jgi:hypothetical protein